MFNDITRWWVVFDTFLLDRGFQPVSDWFRDLTGHSNFWIAKWCFRMLFAASTAIVIYHARQAYFDPKHVGDLAMVLFMAFVCKPWILFKISTDLDNNEDAIVENLELSGTMNPERMRGAGLRFLVVTLSMFIWPFLGATMLYSPQQASLPISLQTLYMIVAIAAYFMACTPRPRAPQLQPKSVAI